MISQPFKLNKLVIFGVGLIGGSLALALKRANSVDLVVGLGRNGDSLQTALDLRVIDAIATDIGTAMQDADMVVIAAPVAQTGNILDKIAPHLSANTIITDVGSTKSDVLQSAASVLGSKIDQFVGGHPIAGAEKTGPAAARPELFNGKNVVLTPSAKSRPEAIASVRQMWQMTGANLREMQASQHDRIFAAVSHLPHLLAFALVDELAKREDAGLFFEFAASGFRDFTRIAGSSPEMWRDISLANRDALLKEIAAYETELNTIKTLLQNSDGQGLQSIFEHASSARNQWAATKEPQKKD